MDTVNLELAAHVKGDGEPREGVDIDVFLGIVKLFNKRYPNKACGTPINDLIPLLKKLDALFASMPDMPPKKRKRRSSPPSR